MIIKIKAFASFREILGREVCVELGDGSNVSDLICRLCEMKPDLRKAVFTESGEIKDYFIIMVNRRRLDIPSDLDIMLSDQDEIAIFPPVAGG